MVGIPLRPAPVSCSYAQRPNLAPSICPLADGNVSNRKSTRPARAPPSRERFLEGEVSDIDPASSSAAPRPCARPADPEGGEVELAGLAFAALTRSPTVL